MSKELMVKYFNGLEFISTLANDLKTLHEDDLYFVLKTLLPENTNVSDVVKDLKKEWNN
jgi:hypothetical protein